MKKRSWLTDHLFLICALLWYLAAGLKYINGSAGVTVWFCLGSCYLCIYVAQLTKRRKDRETGGQGD